MKAEGEGTRTTRIGAAVCAEVGLITVDDKRASLIIFATILRLSYTEVTYAFE
jgi:hypothetical protein